MANVTATDRHFDDPRFDTAGVLLGVDGDLVRLKMQRLWSWQTERYTPETPTYVVGRAQIIGIFKLAAAVEALVEAELVEPRDGGYYIRGTEGVIEWLWKKKAAGQKGRAEQVKRGAARAHPGHTPGTTQGADRVLTGPCDLGSEIRDPEIPDPGVSGKPDDLPLLALQPPTPKPAKPDPAAELAGQAVAAINAAAGRTFDPATAATVKLCRALVGKFATADVLAAVRHRAGEWMAKPAMVEYVRPSSLLTVEQVSKTLDEIRAGPPTRASPPPIRGQVPISTTRHHDGDQPL